MGFSARAVAAMTEANGHLRVPGLLRKGPATPGWCSGLSSRQCEETPRASGHAFTGDASKIPFVEGEESTRSPGSDRASSGVLFDGIESPLLGGGDREGVWQRSRSRSRSSRSLRSGREVRVAVVRNLSRRGLSRERLHEGVRAAGVLASPS